MHYKDYYGSVECSDKDSCFYGKVLGISSLILFEGSSVEELQNIFIEKAVSFYTRKYFAK